MVKVKAKYHFLDRVACRNRIQGDEFLVSDERAEELIKAGLVESLEPKINKNKETTEKQAEKVEERKPPEPPPTAEGIKPEKGKKK